MKSLAYSFLRDDQGQDLIEYNQSPLLKRS